MRAARNGLPFRTILIQDSGGKAGLRLLSSCFISFRLVVCGCRCFTVGFNVPEEMHQCHVLSAAVLSC